MGMNLHENRKIVLVFIVTGLFLLLAFGLGNLQRSNSYSTFAIIENFSVCNITKDDQGYPKNITICGKLVTDGTALLAIYLYKMPEKKLITENPVNDEFHQGYFMRLISLPSGSVKGDYELDVYFYRNIIYIEKFTMD